MTYKYTPTLYIYIYIGFAVRYLYTHWARRGKRVIFLFLMIYRHWQQSRLEEHNEVPERKRLNIPRNTRTILLLLKNIRVHRHDRILNTGKSSNVRRMCCLVKNVRRISLFPTVAVAYVTVMASVGENL